jgi:ABC-type thiamin/hydroxymethylpyrimidine transport system permease subunit
VQWLGQYFIFAVLKKKTRAIPVGIFAGAMSMMAGFPLGINNALFEVHRFSMFLPAPLISMGLVIYLLLPGAHKLLREWSAA